MVWLIVWLPSLAANLCPLLYVFRQSILQILPLGKFLSQYGTKDNVPGCVVLTLFTWPLHGWLFPSEHIVGPSRRRRWRRGRGRRSPLQRQDFYPAWPIEVASVIDRKGLASLYYSNWTGLTRYHLKCALLKRFLERKKSSSIFAFWMNWSDLRDRRR